MTRVDSAKNKCTCKICASKACKKCGHKKSAHGKTGCLAGQDGKECKCEIVELKL